MMRYILFFSVCLFQLCFSEENVEKEMQQKKALEKIENLITNTQNQPRPNNSQTQSNSANRNYSQEQAENPPPENEQSYPESVSENTYSFKKAFYKTISILFGVIILVFVCIWLFRKFGGTKFQSSNSLRTIKIIEKKTHKPKVYSLSH